MSSRDQISKLSVLMPIYNERWTLREIVRRALAAPVGQEIELIAVDDGSTDGSWQVLRELEQADDRIVAIQHRRNRGKGAAIRTAIKHVTGDVAVVQDADLEYDPADFPKLLQPILDGKADAVFGSRFSGHPRRVLLFWHSLANRSLTLISNLLNDLNLTDMETCYKMVRSDVLKQLRLRSNTFTLEPEITCRLAQFGARIYEVPVSYSGRTVQEGKKIRAKDGVKAVLQMFYSRFVATQFTDDSGFYILSSVAYGVSADVDWYARAKDAALPMSLVPRVLVKKRVHDANASLDAAEVTPLLFRALRASINRQRSQVYL